MIIIDTREKGFSRFLPKDMIQNVRLEYGDFSFIGRGENDKPVSIGIERKSIGDFLNSFTTGRFSGHQLPGLLNCYDIIFLILEGNFRFSSNGYLVQGYGTKWVPIQHGSTTYANNKIIAALNTLMFHCNVHVWRTINKSETAQAILGLYHTWTCKSFDKHRSHIRNYKTVVPLAKPSLFERILLELPGIGFDKVKRAKQHFGNLYGILESTEEDWQQISGVGKVIAKAIMQEVRKLRTVNNAH